jgi:transposase
MNKTKIDRRRRHSAELKARILAACAEPGTSVAQVALANGLNAGLVHKWRRMAASDGGHALKSVTAAVPRHDFVPVPILPVNDIRVAIRRGNTAVEVHWPASAAEACAQWLTGFLR